MRTNPKVYVLEDDAGLRKSLAWMLESSGLASATFESPLTFLAEAAVDGPSCLILDMNLPGMSGLELLREMQNRPGLTMPVIVVTGTGDIASAVECMKLGTTDFLEKPIEPGILLAKVRDALEADTLRRQRDSHEATLKSRVKQLTEREREVLRLMCEGKSSKEIAAQLTISTKTVSIHRWHLMKKMQAGSATEAVRLAFFAKAA